MQNILAPDFICNFTFSHLTISLFTTSPFAISPFPTLDTERLRLRELAAADIPEIVALLAEPAIAEMTLNIPHPYHEPDAVYWLNSAYQGFQNNEQYVFAVEQRATGAFMGGIGLTLLPRFDRAEVGYWLGRPFWGQGFATEALRALLHFGFDALALHKIVATHLAKNPASGRVMQKAGMRWEAALPQHVKRDGQYHDLVQYQLLRTDYQPPNDSVLAP